jgi:dUTP pyrophosphatase|tara:strand:+ start:186 stop:710 length:525 start_codon:yes stop_codon:yes gene_type:complete
MRAYIKTDPDNSTLKKPVFAGDAGYDLVAYSNPEIVGTRKTPKSKIFKSIDYIEYDTNVCVAPDQETMFYSLVYPRSSISKYNLILANSVGVVDSGYRNTIKLRFKYIVQPCDFVFTESKEKLDGIRVDEEKIYNKGDKIGQLVWAAHNKPYVEFTQTLPPSERGPGGFGSTGI